MDTQTFRELVSFSNKRFYLGSVMMLFTALLVADWILGIFYALNTYLDASKENNFILQQALNSLNSSASEVFGFLLFSILLGLSFRFIGNSLLAILLAFVVFIPISVAIRFVNFYSGGSVPISFGSILNIIFSAITPFVWIFVGLVLAHLILKKQLPTVIFGGLLGFILNFAASLAVYFINTSASPAPGSAGMSLRFIFVRFIAALAAGLIFGGGWYLLLRLADEKNAADQSPYISKRNYIGNVAAALFAAPIILISFSISFVNAANYSSGSSSPVLLLLMAIVISLVGAITFYLFIYRIWDSIKDGQTARTTPGFAVGGLFIPFYNFYWIFQILPGFAADFNSYRTQRRINTLPLSSTLLITVCILTIASIVPFLGILCAVVNGFILLPMISQVLSAVNAAKEMQTA